MASAWGYVSWVLVFFLFLPCVRSITYGRRAASLTPGSDERKATQRKAEVWGTAWMVGSAVWLTVDCYLRKQEVTILTVIFWICSGIACLGLVWNPIISFKRLTKRKP